MARQWIVSALILGSILFVQASLPPSRCVPEDLCSEEVLFECTHDNRLSRACTIINDFCQEIKEPEKKNEKFVQPMTTKKPGYGSLSKNPLDLCGRSNPNGLYENMEVCEGQAYPGEFPWTIAVFINGTFIGGGTIIAPGVVLTSAHKVRHVSEADIVVRAGEWDLSTTDEEFSYEESRVKKIARHEEFNYRTGANNLALLFLETPFEIKDHIRTICLPKEVKSLAGKRCMVAGWGRQTYTEAHNSDILKKIDLPMVSRDTCQRQLRKTVMGRSYSLAPSLICAGGELDKDACLGDGGSALFCALEDGSDRYEQVGIVNWGIQCGKKDVPATYTNVAMFKEWIDSKVAENSISLLTDGTVH